MVEFPLVQIILYIALFFAPADATRISVTGPTPEDNIELQFTPIGWMRTHEGVRQKISISDTRLLTRIGKQTKPTDVGSYVAALKGHDWSSAPKMALNNSSSLEKIKDGYVYRFNESDTSISPSYTIAYHRPEPVDPTSALSINVIGAVNKPGAYKLAKSANVLDAIIAAGGCNQLAYPKRVHISRGPAGEKPQVIVVDVLKLTEESLPAPVLENRDTIFVSEIIL